jgi:hypothetical protein
VSSLFLDACRFFPTAGGTTDWTFSAAVQGYNSPALANAANGVLYVVRAESADLSQWELSEGAYSTAGAGSFARTTVLYNSSGTGTLQSGAGTKISFNAAPQVAVVALKQDLFRKTDVLGASQVAVQADQETATSTTLAVTPGTQQYHPSAPKAWVRFDANTGTPTIVSSFNVSTLTDNAVGDTSINFTVAFSSNSWSWQAGGDLSTAVQGTGREIQLSAISTGNIRLLTTTVAGALEDWTYVNFVGFGDQ